MPSTRYLEERLHEQQILFEEQKHNLLSVIQMQNKYNVLFDAVKLFRNLSSRECHQWDGSNNNLQAHKKFSEIHIWIFVETLKFITYIKKNNF